MRFLTVAVTFVALAAQFTLVRSEGDSGTTSCVNDIDPCWEVVILGPDPCDNGPVTYCLSRKPNPTITCEADYSHANVWVAGSGVDLTNTIVELPKAYCKDAIAEDTCEDNNDNNGCYTLDGYPFGGSNTGLKCGRVTTGLCVTVEVVDGAHDDVVFALKDRNSCADSITGGITCSSDAPPGLGAPIGDDNTCACSGGLDACIFAGRTRCAPPSGGGGAQGDPHFKTWRGQHFDFHGECDLVLLHSSEFGSGLGLDIHIRT
jgi:hypothetical protein